MQKEPEGVKHAGPRPPCEILQGVRDVGEGVVDSSEGGAEESCEVARGKTSDPDVLGNVKGIVPVEEVKPRNRAMDDGGAKKHETERKEAGEADRDSFFLSG